MESVATMFGVGLLSCCVGFLGGWSCRSRDVKKLKKVVHHYHLDEDPIIV